MKAWLADEPVISFHKFVLWWAFVIYETCECVCIIKKSLAQFYVCFAL